MLRLVPLVQGLFRWYTHREIGVSGMRWAVIFSLVVSISACGNLGKNRTPQVNTSASEVIPLPIIELDQNTGIQFYVDKELVIEQPLPDGTLTRMVLVPGGEFIMGLKDEDPLGIQPAGNIRLAVNSFFIDQYEVTNGQYRAFLASLEPAEKQNMMPDSLAWAREIGVAWETYFWGEGYSSYPVVCVNWHQAKRFAEWAGKRLPKEIEWEYAARSGSSGRIYPWDGIYSRNVITGEVLANFAPDGDYAADGFVITSPVGAFPPNNYRLFDMAGNVAEWCDDAYFPSYKVLKGAMNQIVTPSYQNAGEVRKIARGGSWASNEFFIGVGVRDYKFSRTTSPRLGFRCAQDNNNPLQRIRAQRDVMRRTQQMVSPTVVQYDSPFQRADSTVSGQGVANAQPEPPKTLMEKITAPFTKLWDLITGKNRERGARTNSINAVPSPERQEQEQQNRPQPAGQQNPPDQTPPTGQGQ